MGTSVSPCTRELGVLNAKLSQKLMDHTGQGLTLVHFSAQPKPCWSHLSLSPC